MSSSSERTVGSKSPRTRSETRRVEGGIAQSLEVMNQIQQAAEGEWSAIHDLIDSNSDEERSDQGYLVIIWEENTLLYPYCKYHDGADAEARARFFCNMTSEPCSTPIIDNRGR